MSFASDPFLCAAAAAAAQVWGWVQEMYGFTIGLFLGGVKKTDLYLHMMAQPPWDTELQVAPGKPFYIIHYTYGCDCEGGGRGERGGEGGEGRVRAG